MAARSADTRPPGGHYNSFIFKARKWAIDKNKCLRRDLNSQRSRFKRMLYQLSYISTRVSRIELLLHVLKTRALPLNYTLYINLIY